MLERKPAILAVGEYHEVNGAPKVPSALARFTRELLPALKSRVTSICWCPSTSSQTRIW